MYYTKVAISCKLKLKPFNLTFPTTPTNSSSSPFSNFCPVLYFWPSYLASLSRCFGNTGSALLKVRQFVSHYCLPLPTPRKMTQNKIRTLPVLSTQERVYLSMERCPPPNSSPRDPSQLVKKKRSLQWHISLLMDDLCRCRHSKFWQVPSYSQPWAINLAV